MTGLPLKVQREGNDLVIRLSMETLEFVTKHHPAIANEVRIADASMLLDDVICALSEDNEVGKTLITRAIDDAILEVWERGDESLHDIELDDGSED